MSLLSMDARKDKKISEVLKELVVAMGGAEDPSEVEGKRIAEVLEALKECVSEGGPGPSGVATLATPITYADLVGLRDAGKLTPGMMYRITDYECTVRLSDTDDGSGDDGGELIAEPSEPDPGENSTKSIKPSLKAKLGDSGETTAEVRAVSHPYDIIVIADNEHTLNENARACLRDGDTYYTAEGSVAYLAAWELKYTLDNDRSRFSWADPENGKGVVYWLKDEHDNECPYDFKQIQFKRYKITEFSANPDMVGKWVSSACGTPSSGGKGIVYDPDDYVWAYTFSYVSYETQDDEGSEDDGSKASPDERSDVMPVAVVSDWSVFQHGMILTHENKIGSNMFTSVGMFSRPVDYYVLPDNVFIMDIEGDEVNAPFSNTFGDECFSNTFGNGCYFNTFGNGCNSNTFGNGCFSNTFGDECNSNTFGDECNSNTFGDECNSNTFGDECFSNTFGNGFYFNTFGNRCFSNTFGNECNSNTYGDECFSNTFGNSAGNSETSAYCRWCTFEDGVQYVQLTNNSATNNSQIQNYHVLNGTQGTSSGKITISASLGLAYCTFVGKNSSGVVKTWVPADLAQ